MRSARVATTVRASSAVAAALITEAGQAAGVSRNGDADDDDDVVAVYPLPGGPWTNVGQAADSLAVNGTRVAFLTPEAAQNAASLNGDGDPDDRDAQLWDVGGADLRNVGVAAEDFVLGAASGTVCGPRQLLAIRVDETADGNVDQNGDGDDQGEDAPGPRAPVLARAHGTISATPRSMLRPRRYSAASGWETSPSTSTWVAITSIPDALRSRSHSSRDGFIR